MHKRFTLHKSTTLIDVLWHPDTFNQTQSLLRQITLIVLGSVLMAASAYVEIPFYPVPITGQTFAVILISLCFGSRLAFLSTLTYLAEGALGLPVFAGGAAGYIHLFSPSGGYLFGFLAAALVSGLFAEQGYDKHPIKLALAITLGHAIIFAFGLVGLGLYFGFDQPLLTWGLYPFIPGLCVKTLAILAVLSPAWAWVKRFK
ncbi:MAG TPA: biotin transporter BioY [Oligoflexia bacterium]|nr:biotin transporter BioY [Oligoflexia bacterium]HMR25027.1 biotin transporter BioY [Oligoflexia bacterium]